MLRSTVLGYDLLILMGRNSAFGGVWERPCVFIAKAAPLAAFEPRAGNIPGRTQTVSESGDGGLARVLVLIVSALALGVAFAVTRLTPKAGS